ncbi:hypothetical protein VNO78_15507 [Psophocarpus tetragonolobus]|uniref:Uncharacterized protein n=1 Tax=Psophocarpus tetragonolobus TaxID=3891 RepID=A0AAN9SEQ4_PSOTE
MPRVLGAWKDKHVDVRGFSSTNQNHKKVQIFTHFAAPGSLHSHLHELPFLAKIVSLCWLDCTPNCWNGAGILGRSILLCFQWYGSLSLRDRVAGSLTATVKQGTEAIVVDG